MDAMSKEIMKEYEAIREALKHVNDKGSAICPFCGSDTFSVWHIALTATVKTTNDEVLELNESQFFRVCCTICGTETNVPLHDKKDKDAKKNHKAK
jgi:predicted nucleic-acid-binding Zn-ribbon protein